MLGNRGNAFTTESTGSTEGEVDGREEGQEARAGVGVIGVQSCGVESLRALGGSVASGLLRALEPWWLALGLKAVPLL